jgi:predicted DNA binding CopG/RHH family protein
MREHVEREQLPDIELPPEEDAKVARMIEEADRDEAAGRVNFFWGKEQVDTVKRAADQMGVPYQDYIKQVVYRQAIADLRAAWEALAPEPHVAAPVPPAGG